MAPQECCGLSVSQEGFKVHAPAAQRRCIYCVFSIGLQAQHDEVIRAPQALDELAVSSVRASRSVTPAHNESTCSDARLASLALTSATVGLRGLARDDGPAPLWDGTCPGFKRLLTRGTGAEWPGPPLCVSSLTSCAKPKVLNADELLEF